MMVTPLDLVFAALLQEEKGVPPVKLVACPICHDAFGLLGQQWRICVCGASGGQYNQDYVTATVGGAARVFGVGNPFFNELFPRFTPEQKRQLRQELYGQETDCWWGEHPGDLQIFRVENPGGPQVRMKVTSLGLKENRLDIVDRRRFTVDGKEQRKVVVPANPSPYLRQLLQRRKANGRQSRR